MNIKEQATGTNTGCRLVQIHAREGCSGMEHQALPRPQGAYHARAVHPPLRAQRGWPRQAPSCHRQVRDPVLHRVWDPSAILKGILNNTIPPLSPLSPLSPLVLCDYAKIIEKSGYASLPWVRYLCTSGDYQFRT